MMVTGTIADNAIVGSRLAGLASPGCLRRAHGRAATYSTQQSVITKGRSYETPL
jgi:hypothetical protein